MRHASRLRRYGAAALGALALLIGFASPAYAYAETDWRYQDCRGAPHNGLTINVVAKGNVVLFWSSQGRSHETRIITPIHSPYNYVHRAAHLMVPNANWRVVAYDAPPAVTGGIKLATAECG